MDHIKLRKQGFQSLFYTYPKMHFDWSQYTVVSHQTVAGAPRLFGRRSWSSIKPVVEAKYTGTYDVMQ